MSRDFDDFIYKKVQTELEDRTYFYWYLIHRNSRNGAHFHGCQYSENYDSSTCTPWEYSEHGTSQYRFASQGIEIHSTKPLYNGHKPLSSFCNVTQGDCYCDGTSLYADRELGFINPSGADDEIIWNVLHNYYSQQFPQTECEAA